MSKLGGGNSSDRSSWMENLKAPSSCSYKCYSASFFFEQGDFSETNVDWIGFVSLC